MQFLLRRITSLQENIGTNWHNACVSSDQTVTNCHQLKLQADDGKMRKTDVADIKTIFRIIQSVPSKKAESIKQWLAKVGQERVQEMADPSTAIDRA